MHNNLIIIIYIHSILASIFSKRAQQPVTNAALDSLIAFD